MASVAGLDLDLLLQTGELRMRTATGPLKLDELHFVLLQVFLPRTLRLLVLSENTNKLN